MKDVTRDSLKAFHLTLEQPARGPRYSLDPLLLAFFVAGFSPRRVMEMGSGVGVGGLVLSRRCPTLFHLELVEIQHRLAEMARSNVRENPTDGVRIQVRHEDARYVMSRLPLDIVMSNPPYRDFQTGRVSPAVDRAVARHWYLMKPLELLRSAGRLLAPDGKLCLVLPASHMHIWREMIETAGFKLQVTWPVQPSPEAAPSLFLVACGRESGCVERPPLILRDKDGKYTPEAAEILGIIC